MAKKKAAKKPETIRRRTISIPPDLDDRLEQYPDVSWSAVACAAFRAKLGQLAAEKERKTMADKFDRFAAAEAAEAGDAHNAGYARGYEWAGDRAEPRQVTRLLECSDWDWSESYSPWWDMAAVALGKKSNLHDEGSAPMMENDEAEQFWRLAIGDDDWKNTVLDDGFVAGFAQGASKFLNDYNRNRASK